MNHCLEIAQERGLTGLISKIKQEQNKVNQNLEVWESMLLKNASVREKMEKTQLDDYIKRAIKFSHIINLES